jgi:hypothetical protein
MSYDSRFTQIYEVNRFIAGVLILGISKIAAVGKKTHPNYKPALL